MYIFLKDKRPSESGRYGVLLADGQRGIANYIKETNTWTSSNNLKSKLSVKRYKLYTVIGWEIPFEKKGA
jgi:hypothetical protein